MFGKLFDPLYQLMAFIVCGAVILTGLLFFSPAQGPVIVYKLALVELAAVVGLIFDFLAFPYALPSSYLIRDWRKNPTASGEDGKPDFPVIPGCYRVFAGACIRRALIVSAFVLAVALGL